MKDIKLVIKTLENEMEYCEEHPSKSLSKDYQKGFICGLRQAIYLVKKVVVKK